MKSLASIACGLLCVSSWAMSAQSARGEENYPSAYAAMADARKFIEKKDYKSAQAPLEAALKLADNDALRLGLYNNLMPCYRLLPENEKMIEACEFTIAKTRTNAERSITARSLTSFMYQRGKLDELRTRYEQRLEKDADDLVALSVLSYIHQNASRDKEKAAPFKARLEKAEQKRNGQLAEEEEQLAAKDPNQTTWRWKDAARFWNYAANPVKALAAAKQAEATGPEKRSQYLTHSWHSQLGEVYLASNAPQDAVRHFEKALENATSDSAKKTCEEKLAQAKAKLSEKKP